MPMVRATVMVMTPMVAAVPKEVPVRTERMQLSKKASSRKAPGRISPDSRHTISGIVPAAHHRAVSIPMSRKVHRIVVTGRMPSRLMRSSDRQEQPRRRPYRQNSAQPNTSAISTSQPAATQTISPAQKIPNVTHSMVLPPSRLKSPVL